MRILQVITSLRTGGAEKLMIDLIPRLTRKGHEIDLLLFDGTETHLKKDALRLNINIIELGKGRSPYSFVNLKKLIPLLTKYDIIHTHNTAPQLFGAIGSIGKKINLITTEHGGSNRRRKIKCFKIIDKWIYGRYNNVICISDQTEKNFRTYLGKSKTNIITINNGIDILKYSNAVQGEDLEKIAPNSKKIIMVAGFRWEKDHPTVIKALKHLPENYHLFLIGDGVRRKEYETLVEQIKLKERVHFLGIRTDIPVLLKSADYIVLSSHFEGLSLSSIEGMAAGKPFLASDVDGLHDIADSAGILFPHEDSEALASLISKLESSPELYEEVSEKCSLRASEFDIEYTVSQYNNIYNAIVNHKI